MGLYVLLADDDHEGYESEAVWEPRLYEWQQKAANVLFFTFIHPITMDVPPAFEALAKTRGQDIPGAIPRDTVVLFALGMLTIVTNEYTILQKLSKCEVDIQNQFFF